MLHVCTCAGSNAQKPYKPSGSLKENPLETDSHHQITTSPVGDYPSPPKPRLFLYKVLNLQGHAWCYTICWGLANPFLTANGTKMEQVVFKTTTWSTWSMLPLQLGFVLGSSWPGIVPCGSHSSAGSWTDETSSQTFGWCTSFVTSMRTTTVVKPVANRSTFYFFQQENRIHRSVWVMCRINSACIEDIVLGDQWSQLSQYDDTHPDPSKHVVEGCASSGVCYICNAMSFPSYDKL